MINLAAKAPPLEATKSPLTLDTLALSELSSAAAIGATIVPVAAVDGFQVGGVVRFHSDAPNQEDHRIRAIAHNSLWLSGSGLEFPHTRREVVKMLAIIPECPNNCSSLAACVLGACACPEGYGGDDCSVGLTACENNCNHRGLCIAGVCSCHSGYTGGACQAVAQLCPFNCSGHGLWCATACAAHLLPIPSPPTLTLPIVPCPRP